jgi:TP901 family phage tail tape measure protein
MPGNLENLNYVITFTTEYKDKGLKQAKAALVNFQNQAQQQVQKQIGLYAKEEKTPSGYKYAAFYGRQTSGVHGPITLAQAEKQMKDYVEPRVKGEIGKSYEASLANLQNQFTSGSIKVSDYRKALTNLQLTYGKSVLDVEKLDKSSQNFLNTQTKLAMRAIAVIPIWMALRTIYQQVFETISSGVSTIINLDRELARIKTVTTDVSNMGDFLGELGQKAMKMSRETGVAVEDILHAFYGFKDAGLSTEVAMAGMESSVKGAIALFGDLKETAKTLTDIYVLMGDRITEVKTPQEKMNYIMSSIAVLQRTNKFELNEYMEGLKTFTGTAAAANLTLDQMTFLLAKTHTFMQRGSRGGTDLSNALRKLSQNAEKAEIFLGRPINLNGTSRFELMLEIIDKLNAKMKAGQDITKNINDIFGIRGTAAINAFTINLKSVTEQWKEFSDLSPERRMEIWMDQFNTASLTIERQVARLQKIKEQLGANFVAGVLGIDLSKTRDAAEAIKVIDDRLQDLIPTAKALGEVIKPILLFLTALAAFKGIGLLQKTLSTKAGLAGLVITGASVINEQLMKEFKESQKASASEQYQAYLKSGGKLGPGLWKEMIASGNKEAFGIELEPIKIIKKENELINQTTSETANIESDITKLFDYRLLQAERLKVYGFSEIEIAKEKLRLMELRDDASVKEEDIEKQRLNVLKLQNEEIITYSQNLQNAVSTSFNDIMSGKGGNVFDSITNTIGENFRTVLSEGMSKTLIGATGFGEFFGETMSGLKGQIESGHKIVYDLIRKGHVDGLNSARGINGASWAGATTGSGLVGSNGAPVVVGPGGQLITGTSGEVMAGYGTTGSKTGGFLSNLFSGKYRGVAQSGLMGYSGYQSSRSGGAGNTKAIGQGLLGVGALGAMGAMGAFGAGFSGYMATNAAVAASMAGSGASLGGGSIIGGIGAGLAAIGPLGWLAIAAAITGLGLSLFGEQQEQESTTSRTSSNTISSKINVTNKQLELVNRNLIALRTDIRTYILPQSSYFSAKSSLDEEFSLSSRMASVE